MDRGSDKYLHKKFKKQLNVEPPKAHHQCDDEEAKKTTVPANGAAQASPAEDNKDSVPNQSTNQPNPTVPPSSSSPPGTHRSSISRLEEQTSDTEATIRATTTCISYTADADTVSLDRKCSVSEPNVDDTRQDQSSILDSSRVSPEEIALQDHQEDPNNPCDDRPTLPDRAGGGKHVCPYCSLACSKPSVLQKHIRAHTNERPYPCDSCGFSFKTRSNLYKHCRSRTHANRVLGNKLQEIVTEMETESPGGRSPPPEDRATDESLEGAAAEKTCQEQKSKPYKPRFHTAFLDSVAKENVNDNEKAAPDGAAKRPNSDLLSMRINEVISKNNSIVNSPDSVLLKRRSIDHSAYQDNNNEYPRYNSAEEPLNLTKNRKRCMSEVTEPAQKSLIKELLLKNLYADTNMQCPYCKMIFQTVTELELHKLRNCKGFTKSGARYNRSSSVNVASILTQNKNAFDSFAFPVMKSPGPFLGKTRLVESDKSKSFSFDDNLAQTSLQSPIMQSTNDFLRTSQRYALSPLTIQTEKEKKPPVKLFGGEVKIAHTSGETKSFKIDSKDDQFGNDPNYLEYGAKLSENRLVKSTLQSGGVVLTNKPAYTKQESLRNSPDVIRVYENNASSAPKIELGTTEKTKFAFDNQDAIAEQKSFHPAVQLRSLPETNPGISYKYTNIMDFSQKAAKMLTPNLNKLNLSMPGIPLPNKLAAPPIDGKPRRSEAPEEVAQNYSQKEADVDMRNLEFAQKQILMQQKPEPTPVPLYNPVNLLVDGKVVRYVPGIPGPVVAEAPLDMAAYRAPGAAVRLHKPSAVLSPPEPIAVSPSKKLPTIAENHCERTTDGSPKPEPAPTKPPASSPEKAPNPPPATEPRKFARPNSLALKPTLAVMKTHHGLTPTVFNQVLISPDTPRVAKKYNQHMMQGNYFTYLGLKSSTKSVYCTLNKTQPVYVPHFKKLSMYSEWRQQENKSDKLYVSAYDSRQRQQKYSVAGRTASEMTVVHSSYKHVAPDLSPKGDDAKTSGVVAAYECNDEYAYARGRDESTRQQEHEAAYGLLSLSQKTTSPPFQSTPSAVSPAGSSDGPIDDEEVARASKRSFAKNRILDQRGAAPPLRLNELSRGEARREARASQGMRTAERPLTYPYATVPAKGLQEAKGDMKSIRHFQVIQNYNRELHSPKKPEPNYIISPKLRSPQVPIVKVNDKTVLNSNDGLPTDLRKRKISVVENVYNKQKIQRNDEVMDLSVPERRRSPENIRYNGSSEHMYSRNNIISDMNKKNSEYSENSEMGYYRLKPTYDENSRVSINYVIQERTVPVAEYDNSAMETLADIATKQVKLERNSIAKNVASELLKLATKNEYAGEGMPEGGGGGTFTVAAGKKVNELIVKPEENKSCTICSKSFSKPSQLRLHMNIHYLERPFRCDSCSVGFRTKGQLQKHERSAGHHNKLSSSPALSSSEPRPFKCTDCNIAFRIHGHLAKHLRSKMHIMKLECLAKIPFGLYAELERSNSLLTEINTADGDQCLDSLKSLAKKVFINDPNKLNQLEAADHEDADS